jgi:hypothetical protein
MEVTPSGLHHVFENRKLAQRNISIIDPPPEPGGGGGAGGSGAGFMFVYEFAIGHALRESKGTRLHLRAERHLEEVRLFLDPADLVQGLEKDATLLDWEIPLDATRIPSGEQGVQRIVVPGPPKVVGRGARGPMVGGLTVSIPRGTEFGILAEPDRADCALQIRFEDDVRVRIGGHGDAGLEERHGMRGLRPVILNGLPLLEITDAREVAVSLPLSAAEKRTLRLFGVVSRSGAGSALYHLTEQLGDRVLGGVSLQINAQL